MIYGIPISQEYNTRGCKVKIDASTYSDSVTVTVTNINTGYTGTYVHVLSPVNNQGYTEYDMREIHENLNTMLDQYGESECNEIHFTNQILS